MNVHSGVDAGQLAQLRASFDRGFAAPPRPRGEDLESILLVRTGEEVIALRTRHIASLARIERILPIPGRMPELLGIAGVRGKLTAVFDLAALLGVRRGESQCRWLALTPGETAAALAFEAVEGHVSVPRGSFHVYQSNSARGHIKELARSGSAGWPVADVAAIVTTIRRHAGLADSEKE